MASLLFQVRHELDHEELKSIVNNNEQYIDAISGSNMIDFMPWLGVIFPGKMKSITELVKKIRDILGVHVNNHHDNYEHDLQKRMQEEMDDVIGRDRLPSLADRGRLPLTEAFLAEVSRHSSVVPTTLPHSTIRDTILEGGYNLYIPKDTVVFVNLYSIHCDPEEWNEPGKFDPKRFLSQDGQKLDNDKVDSLMRFGVGRRRCIGSEVAQMELFLYFSVILHQCSLRSTEGQKLTLKGEGSLLVVRPPKYDMEMVLR
ncbi:putative cytochrome P450 1A1-like [Apostichopus japonicus]|uniref:Putative cytochrome P450 1A1-like n=1 Tax=Stichopus japonicus TaxID=307972 RepID=A0A2G8JNT4_STIJA|nr:putative cytochrome P450 1A1-like [Apostichopus japonicus]